MIDTGGMDLSGINCPQLIQIINIRKRKLENSEKKRGAKMVT